MKWYSMMILGRTRPCHVFTATNLSAQGPLAHIRSDRDLPHRDADVNAVSRSSGALACSAKPCEPETKHRIALLRIELFDKILKRGHEAQSQAAVLEQDPLPTLTTLLDACNGLEPLPLTQTDEGLTFANMSYSSVDTHDKDVE